MYKLISWYNQNRRKFWRIVVTIFIVILIAWRLMYTTTNRNTGREISQSPKVDTSNLNSITLETSGSSF